MGLPTVALPRETLTLPGGQTVEVRGLSRGEAVTLKPLMEAVASDNGDGPTSGPAIRSLEVALISRGCDVTEAEAEAWYDAAGTEVVTPMVTRIMALSALDEGGARPTSEG